MHLPFRFTNWSLRMCLLAMYFRVAADAPVIIGANREEFYARGGEPPQRMDAACRILAGRDPRAGGTWLGVNEHGIVAAVTNRAKSDVPAEPRSRGLLTRDLLDYPSAAAAVERAVGELDSGSYAGCNLLVADAERAVVVHAGEWLHVNPLPPGLHVVTSTRDVNDDSDPRIGHALGWLSDKPSETSAECLAALAKLCGQTGQPPMCFRGRERGTVSSSLIALRPGSIVFLHAQGPPDRTPYVDYSAHLSRSAKLTPDS
jgi:hypothetical protein